MRGEDEDIGVEAAVERVEAAHDRVDVAARGLSEDAFERAGKDVLAAHVETVQRVSQQVLYVALSGELPPEEEASPLPAERDALLARLKETLDSLYVHVREADPDEFAYVTWGEPGSSMNWRSWLISLEVEGARCAVALEGIDG